MTTSGTTTFNRTRDQIIRGAMRKVGAIAAGDIPSAALTNDFADQLNMMVKHWMATGLHIWTTAEAIMYTTRGQAAYQLGAGTNVVAYTVKTTTTCTAAAVLNATVISMSSNYLMVGAGIIGFTLDDGTVQWTTISSFTTTTVTIPTGLTDSMQAFNTIYLATSGIDRPLRIPAARRWDSISNEDIPMSALSRLDYQALPNKLQQGVCSQYWYDPRGGANSTGILYLWQTPSNVLNNNVKFTFYRPIQDFNTAADTPDLPVEWLNTLTFNLALQMCPEFGITGDVYTQVKEMAMFFLDEVKGWDREPESTYFGVDFQRMG